MSFSNSSCRKNKHNFDVPDIFTNGITEYHKKGFLGKGGYALCYKVYDPNAKTYYAAKVVSKRKIYLSQTSKRFFEKELEIHKNIDHPNIVKFIDNFEIINNQGEELFIIILELCGESLSSFLRREKRFDENKVKIYLTQIISALRYLHSKGIVHRDIKLGNMLLSENRIKLCDFGMADYVAQISNNICGTPNYISPEVLNRGEITGLTDVWSLGVCMYSMLFGRAPFETGNVKTTYQRIKDNIYHFPDTNKISDSAKKLIQKMLIKVPNQRISLDEILFDPFFKSNEKIHENKKNNCIDVIYQQLLTPNDCIVETIENPRSCVSGYYENSKYGLFYRLSNGEFGVYFNDGDIMVTLDSNNVLYVKRKKKNKEHFQFENIAKYNSNVQKKLKLLQYSIKITPKEFNLDTGKLDKEIYVLKYLKTTNAHFLRLNNGVIQVNFIDGIRVIISDYGKIITYVTKDKEITTQSLSSAMQDKQIAIRVNYIRDILENIITRRQN